MVEVPQHKTSNNNKGTNNTTNKRSTILDAVKELYNEFIASQRHQGSPITGIIEGELGSDIEEAIDKKLQGKDHEDEIRELGRILTAGKLRGRTDKNTMVGENKSGGEQQEFQAGGGRHRGTGTGGDFASSAAAEDENSNTDYSVNNDRDGRDDDDGDEKVVGEETTHDKRSCAGRAGASAKVGYVDSATVMARAKFKYEGPEGSGPFADGSLPPVSTPDTPTPEQLEKDDEGNPKYRLGFDLWKKIYWPFYPSEQSVLASVNKEWRSRIYHLSVWQKICEAAGLALPANELEAHGYEKPNYYQLAHENADMICEQCYKITRPAGSFRALPVAVTDAVVPYMIRMCHDCRVDYYIDHPEPVPDDVTTYKAGEYTVTPRMTKGDAMKTYLLSDSDVMSLPYEIGRNPYFGPNSSMYLIEEQHVLSLARQIHGGDIGIAAARSDSEYTGRKIPESHDDVIKHRRNLLRSMLHDKGLHLPEHAAICSIYIETGLGNPLEIVQELEVIDWFHRYTSYDPSLDKAHLQQVKRRPRINCRRRTLPESETLMSANLGGVAVQSIQDDMMTEEEEEEDDHHKMVALDDWLTHRLEQGQYRSYKLDPEGPERPPKVIWTMLDKIDMSHKIHEFAAEKVYRAMEKEKHEIKREGGLDKLIKSKAQVRSLVDAPESGRNSANRSSELSRQKRPKTERSNGKEGDQGKEAPKLSTYMEHDLGSDWHSQVVQRAKELAQSHL
ncbi:hypothetical protein EC957_004655 [Mortierella hygrophila]|uniref:Uncharacterized protein n=1 Tax=Mortierella hygrophila TaxID=979708 RepID=A0A9P6F1S1_9FUNG|nr:hypothetical protein EC957_004655 [Mortierella hygrophila]